MGWSLSLSLSLSLYAFRSFFPVHNTKIAICDDDEIVKGTSAP